MSRSLLSPTTGVTYYLCEWQAGCNMPVRTNPSGGGDTLCRWHAACLHHEHPAQVAGQFAAFESWLAQMQHHDPSRGAWSWEVTRLWPILTGQREAM